MFLEILAGNGQISLSKFSPIWPILSLKNSDFQNLKRFMLAQLFNVYWYPYCSICSFFPDGNYKNITFLLKKSTFFQISENFCPLFIVIKISYFWPITKVGFFRFSFLGSKSIIGIPLKIRNKNSARLVVFAASFDWVKLAIPLIFSASMVIDCRLRSVIFFQKRSSPAQKLEIS